MAIHGTFHTGDCLEVMKDIPDGSVDMVLCDPPYGMTCNKWDSVIDLDQIWLHYARVCTGAIVLTAAQPFTSRLVMSNLAGFKYQWVWAKNKATGYLNANRQPLRNHEDICVFYGTQCVYNPQYTIGKAYSNSHKPGDSGDNYGSVRFSKVNGRTTRYPRTLLQWDVDRKAEFHPTQKPVALFEYLIRTYTNPGMTVLDNCAGSGTTAIACENTGRNWILIEKDERYAATAKARIEAHVLGKCA